MADFVTELGNGASGLWDTLTGPAGLLVAVVVAVVVVANLVLRR